MAPSLTGGHARTLPHAAYRPGKLLPRSALSVLPGSAHTDARLSGCAAWRNSCVARAVVAASSLAEALRLRVDEVVVIHNSNKLALRLLPCDTLARTALVGQEVADFEIRVAESLAAVSAPVASPDPRVEPRVYERDGFAVTFWSYYRPVFRTRSRPNMQTPYAVCMGRCATSRSRRRTSRNASRRQSIS